MLPKKQLNKIKIKNYIKAIGYNYNEVLITNGEVTLNIDHDHSKDQNTDDFLTIDSKDCIISPGFIDVQVNGFENESFWDIANSPIDIDKIRLKLAYCGVVAFCPTLITNSYENIIKSINKINSYIKSSCKDEGANILGIHIEGIFITKYGVHPVQFVQKELTVKNIEPLVQQNVILFTLAPELDKAGEAIKFLQKNNILVSIGHSNGSFKDGDIAINKYGLKTVTHMFNSLRGIEGFSHRTVKDGANLEIIQQKLENIKNIDIEKDGIMLALLKEKNVLCMVIADGIHVNKEVLSLLKSYKDTDHFSLTSDIVTKTFYEKSNKNSILGGSQTTIDSMISNLVKWDIMPVEEALICASKPIANQLKGGKESTYGEIKPGKKANIVLWDTRKNCVKGTIIGQNVFLNY